MASNDDRSTRDSGASAKPPGKKRAYDSPVRRKKMAATRELILTTAVNLVHESPSWDWKNLSASTVADAAGLGRRTVQRHFPTEKLLRDEVMIRTLTESGIELDKMSLDNFGQFIDQTFSYLASFQAAPITPPITDPSLASMDKLRRDAMVAAVTREIPNCPERDREAIAALLDLFWHQPSFERLAINWGVDTPRAIALLTWAADLVTEALQSGKRPPL